MIKLYVGNLPYSYDESNLRALFAAYGNILSATIIMDRDTNRSKGFGFVELEDDAMAQTAISELNGTEVEGRGMVVNEARPMTDRPRTGGFDRNGGGNRSGGFGGRGGSSRDSGGRGGFRR